MSSTYPFGGTGARPCMRCGAALAPTQGQCSRCGLYNPLPQGPQSGMVGQGSAWSNSHTSSLSLEQQMQAKREAQWANPHTSGLSLEKYLPPGQSLQNGSQTGAVRQDRPVWGYSQPQVSPQPQRNQFAGPNTFGPPNRTGFASPHPSQSLPNSTFPSSQPYANQPSFTTFASALPQSSPRSSWNSARGQEKPAWMQMHEDKRQAKKKESPGAGVVAIIVIVVVLLIGGGIFGTYKMLKAGNNASSNSTLPALTTPSTTPLFKDTFQDNAHNWDTTPQTGAKVTLAGGKLVLESDNNKLLQEPLPGGKTYGDLRLDINAELTSGDPNNGYGIYIRGASTQNSPLGLYYRFEIYGDGSFVVYKGTQDADGNGQSAPLTSETAGPNKAINPEGGMNHLTIIAQGSQLTLIVNGTAVASFADPSYKSGTVALFVSNVQHVSAGAQATFENLAIFPPH